METLLQCLVGTRALRANRKVGFRVLSRVADVLEGCREMEQEFTAKSRNLHGLAKRESLMWDEEKTRSDLRYLSDLERDDRVIQQRIFSQFAGFDRVLAFLDGLFLTREERAQVNMEETAAVGRAQEFVEAAKKCAVEAWERAAAEGLGVLKSSAENSDSSSSGASSILEEAELEFHGRYFPGTEDDPEVDLSMPPYYFEGELGGAMSIFVGARWDSLNFRSRLFDFGSGCPKDNITAGNQGNTNHLLFEFFLGTDEISKKIVIQDSISVGSMNKYLLTVSERGHMKVWRDGSILGEKNVGCCPKLAPRSNLFVGKSSWSSHAPFHGAISDLKVWHGKVMDWDDVVKDDDPTDDDEHAEGEEAPERSHIMKAIFDVHARDDTVPEKQELKGGLSRGSLSGNTFSESVFTDESKCEINPAYAVAAVLRAGFVMLKVPATEKIRRDMVTSLCRWLTILRLSSLVELVGMFSCRVAAKFLRLMSCALELPASETTAKLDLVVSGDLVAAVYGRVCHEAAVAAQHDDPEVRQRGCELCTEIARAAGVVCRTMTFCNCSEVKPIQLHFVVQCLEKVMPIAVIKSLIQMLIQDSQPPQGEGAQGMGEEMWELSRSVLSQLLDTCHSMKHPILKVFSENLVTSSVSLRPSFLSALLAQSRQSFEESVVSTFLNSEGNPHRQAGGGGVEKVIMSVKTQVLVSGTPLVVFDYSHPEACFVCMLTNKGLHLVDITSPGYPETPTIVQIRRYADMTRLVKGEATQVLHIGWVVGDGFAQESVTEQFMTLICHSEPQRNELFSKLQVLSEPPGGNYRHRAVVQSDVLFRTAMETKVPEATLLTAFVLVERRLEFFILGEGRLYQCNVHFDRWLPPKISGEGEDKDKEEAEEGGNAEGSEADQTAHRRLRATETFESGITQGDLEKNVPNLISFVQPQRELARLEQVAFYRDRQPRTALFFRDDDTVELVFFDDTTRERWRKSLMAQLARLADEGGTRPVFRDSLPAPTK